MSEPVTRTSPEWIIPAAIFTLAAALYALLGSLQQIPLVAPDEFLYGHLARSVGQGDGMIWYPGAEQTWRTALYIYLIAPSWAFASSESAYELAKLISAAAVCTVVFPVWVLARRLTPARHAAVPVVLTVAGTWMITTGGLLSENLAYPLCTAALISMVLALREPGQKWVWIALGFSVLAVFTRAQMVVLFPIMLVALALDLAWAEHPSQRLQRYRVPASVLGVIVFTALAVLLSGSSSVLGSWSVVSDFSPSLSKIATATGDQWIALAIACGVLPLAALFAVGADRSAWTDKDFGPLLCVCTSAVVLLLIETGFFNAGSSDEVSWSIERYVQYAIPLLLVLLFTALDRGRIPALWLAGAGAAIGASLLATPDVEQAFEERARFATSDVVGASPALSLALAAFIISGAAFLILTRAPRARVVYAVGGLLLAVFALQSQSIWRVQVDISQQVRAQYPPSLTWVNDNAPGPVTRMYLFQNSALFQVAELFNDEVEQVLTPSVDVPGVDPLGPLCSWTASGRGVVQIAPACGPMRGVVWNDDPFISMSFHGGKFLARDPMLGQLMSVPENPRLRSMIRNACQRATLTLNDDGTPKGIPTDLPCTPHMSINLWLDAPGTLELTFSGGADEQRVQYQQQSWTLPAGKPTTIKIAVNAAAASIALALDWEDPRGTPRVTGAAFVTDGKREPLL